MAAANPETKNITKLSMHSSVAAFRQKFLNDQDFQKYCVACRSLTGEKETLVEFADASEDEEQTASESAATKEITIRWAQRVDFAMAILLNPSDSDSSFSIYTNTVGASAVNNWATTAKGFLGFKASDTTDINIKDEISKFYGSQDLHELTLKTLCDVLKKADKKDTSLAEKQKDYSNICLTATLLNDFEKTLNRLITPSFMEDIVDLIEEGECRQIIFTGAPGTGKTYTAKEIANDFLKKEKAAILPSLATLMGTDEPAKNDLLPYVQVQFHPSYDYTDFVEGLRPIQLKQDTNTDKNDSMFFAKVDGKFKEFCRRVVLANKATIADQNVKKLLDDSSEDDLDENRILEPMYFFIIDEINRANLSKVFGELMYCLEKDKRGKDHAIQTQYQTLPTYKIDGTKMTDSEDVFHNGFYIPKNVVVLGTMNDIDRSVDSMDFALRRRFEWKEFEVDCFSLARAFDSNSYGDIIQKNALPLAQRIMKLNDYLTSNKGTELGLTRQYYISQGQFANLPKKLTTETTENSKNKSDPLTPILEYVWTYRVESLLREYLRGFPETEISSFLEGAQSWLLEGKALSSGRGRPAGSKNKPK